MSALAQAARGDRLPRVVPVSLSVPGRARVRVERLRGQPRLARAVQIRMAGHPAVRGVAVNPLTGSVLVHFDARRLRVSRLLAALAEAAATARVGRNGRHVPRPSAAPPPAERWHTMTPDEVLDRLGTSAALGLTSREAERRVLTSGDNALPVRRPRSAVAIVRDHVCSLPVLLLGGAAVLSLGAGALLDAGIILTVVVANAAVGYATESRVDRILMALQNGTAPQATVRRNAEEVLVPAASLAPGDVMVLRAGHDVPADGRLLSADGLALDESALTGESVPVAKSATARCTPTAPLGDRRNMVYAGTTVSEGWGLACVTATGPRSEMGAIRALVAETEAPPTPLERQLARRGRTLVGASLGACAAALGLGLWRGVPAVDMLRSVISLAVAAVPEGLPAVATTTLALGMHRLMRQGMLVRRLAAVESLGATTVICADKTGTLTENRMTVHAWYVGGREYRRAEAARAAREDGTLHMALMIAALCNEAELVEGDPPARGSATEAALLAAAGEAGVDYRALRAAHPIVSARPRLNGDNWMATVHAWQGRQLTAVKGAPEAVLARASRIATPDGTVPLDAGARERIHALHAATAACGLRVLALACKDAPVGGDPRYDDLVWIGLVALTDPVRAGVREAIAACRTAGIRTVILTGDHPQTAAAIARELGLGTRVVEPSGLTDTDARRLQELVAGADVFARVSPAHKHQIVRALQAAGHVVAMTGDGINDAAALRAADIGVAMGARGTDIARDVADIVLLEDDFGALVRAVAQGRAIRSNVSRSVRFLLSTNLSEILVTLGALALGLPRALSAVQLLWINLLSDVAPALALAVEPADAAVMAQPPIDPGAPLLSRGAFREVAAEAGLLSAAALVAQAIGLARHGAGPQAASLAFATLTTGQLVHALRYRAAPSVPASRVPHVVAGTVAAQVAAMVVPPLRRLLGVAALGPADWLVVAGGALAPAALHAMRRRDPFVNPAP